MSNEQTSQGVIYVLYQDEVVDTIPLTRENMVIGRETGDIVVDDSEVSTSHCQIRLIEGNYHIFDLNSTNGTFLNDQRILKSKLSDGDRIKLGNVELRFGIVDVEMPKVTEHSIVFKKPAPTELSAEEKEILDLIRAEKERCISSLCLCLEVTYADSSRETIEVPDKRFVIGRLTRQGQFEKDEELSRKHAEISINSEGNIEVTDLGSTNGTFINDVRLDGSKIVSSADIVRAGRSQFKITLKA